MHPDREGGARGILGRTLDDLGVSEIDHCLCMESALIDISQNCATWRFMSCGLVVRDNDEFYAALSF